MELDIKKFEEMVLYSNKTMEKVATSLVNESSNAVLCAMFEDCVLLLDHKESQFYLADYSFDHKNATFVIENFDPINLTKSSVEFKDMAKKYFSEEEVSPLELAEEYKETVMSQEDFISDLITEAMISKDFSEVMDYSELAKINEEVSISNEKFFKTYKDRLSTNPVSQIKYFNWKDPVKVSLLNSEPVSIVTKNVAAQANELWKKAEFKEGFEKASTVFVEDVEKGAEEYKKLFESFPQVLKLTSADRNALFGKTAISIPALRDKRGDLVKGINILFEKNELESMLVEEEGDSGAEIDNAAPDVSLDERKLLSNELSKLSARITEENVKEKIASIISDLSNEETNVLAVKEAVELLTL